MRAASPVPLLLPGRPQASGHTRAPGPRETPSDAILARRVKGTKAPGVPARPPGHILEEEEEGGLGADESKCQVACPSPISPEPDSRADEAQPERP